MRQLSALLLLAVLPLALLADDFKPEKGFTLLFNGKNLDGWKEFSGKTKADLDAKTKAFEGRFVVKDGVLIIDPAVKGDSHIETKQTFGKDVHIKFDFEPGAKCNNDIFLRGTKFDIVPGKNDTKGVKEGEWATCEVIVTGDKVEHKINGTSVRTAKVKDSKATPFRIRAEFGAMKIKNIRVKE